MSRKFYSSLTFSSLLSLQNINLFFYYNIATSVKSFLEINNQKNKKYKVKKKMFKNSVEF